MAVSYTHLVWRVPVGRVSLYLLDTDVPENVDLAKSITHSLYGGDWENRLRQEYLLGIGGTMLLKQLGITCDVYHMNEGHAAFMNVERLVNLVAVSYTHLDLHDGCRGAQPRLCYHRRCRLCSHITML